MYDEDPTKSDVYQLNDIVIHSAAIFLAVSRIRKMMLSKYISIGYNSDWGHIQNSKCSWFHGVVFNFVFYSTYSEASMRYKTIEATFSRNRIATWK